MDRRLFCLLLFFCAATQAVQAQSKRIDTTVKIGRVGYRVVSSNKSPEKNDVSISPIGFENQARDFGFEVKGRIRKAEIDDLNNDGYPDLVMYVYSGDSLQRGNVIGITSEKNQSVNAIVFPDILDDPKLKDGYKGHDEFLLMEGMLVRRFPLYSTDSTALSSAGKMRQLQYRVVPGERGMMKFKVMRVYDYTRQ